MKTGTPRVKGESPETGLTKTTDVPQVEIMNQKTFDPHKESIQPSKAKMDIKEPSDKVRDNEPIEVGDTYQEAEISTKKQTTKRD